MSKRLAYERYLWFHQRIKQGKYPSLNDLMTQFEISHRQAAREIETMRIFFNAPVEYSAIKKGYYYGDNSFEFPAAMITEEELISLVIAKRLSVTIPDKRRKNQLDIFFDHLSSYLGLDVHQLEKKISLKNVRYFNVQPDVFDTVLQGLSHGKKLSIAYRSVHTGEHSQRIINPLHLVLYMGNWHLLAHCEKRKGLRDFALSRITTIQILDTTIDTDLESLDIEKEMDSAYGIFFAGRKEKVVLRFQRKIADYVREQVWFPGQTLSAQENGDVILSFSVTDYREVVREILSFGAEVEVIEPQGLRQAVIEHIDQLSQLYRPEKSNPSSQV